MKFLLLNRTIYFISTLILLSFFSYNTFAQIGKVDQLGDKMFFNILIHKPETSVYDFVKRYFPALAEPPKKGGWHAYSSLDDTVPPIPVYDTTVHSLCFYRHPYFKEKFSEGRLEFFTLENQESGPGITDFQIWFLFNNYADANHAFLALCDSFGKICKFHKIEKKSNKIIARYSDSEKEEYLNCNEIILLPDELYDGRYKILFRLFPLFDRHIGG